MCIRDSDNVLTGAEFSDGFSGPVARVRSETQWVLLDFSETDIGEHQYTAAERAAIIQRMEFAYRGPDTDAPWFDVRITQDVADISVDDYVTIFFNQTPAFGRPGGLASEIDPGNLNLGGTASVQVNGLVGGITACLLYTSPSPRDATLSRMPSSA